MDVSIQDCTDRHDQTEKDDPCCQTPYGMGDQHLDIIASKLLTKYKVDMELVKPKVAFRETIRKTSDVDSKYKKQSGGHGQYGHVKMKFSPLGELDKAYEFIVSTISNVFNVAFISFGSAIGIILSQMLGAGEKEKAKKASTRLLFFAVVTTFFIAVIMVIFAPLFPRI